MSRYFGSPSFTPPVLPAPSFYQHTQLTIPTYDGSGQATHPTVLEITGGFNGYLYWMAMTPFPGNDESFENPSIVASNDGTTWTVPFGLTNPIVSGNTSDPDIVYDGGIIYLFYRVSGLGPNDTIHVKTSTDGITWSADTVILTDSGTSLLSPAVLKDAGGTWRLWAVNMTTNPNTLRMWTASSPTGTWTGPTACTATDPEGRDLWHLDVDWDATNSKYRMFLTTCGLGLSGDYAHLLLGTSSDATTWSFSNTVLAPESAGHFDDYSTGYHTSGFYEQSRYRAWFGAMKAGSPVQWHIGYTEVNPADFP